MKKCKKMTKIIDFCLKNVQTISNYAVQSDRFLQDTKGPNYPATQRLRTRFQKFAELLDKNSLYKLIQGDSGAMSIFVDFDTEFCIDSEVEHQNRKTKYMN